MAKSFPLNSNELFFCDLYVQTSNGTRSYMKAYGGTYENAQVAAHRLLKKTKIVKRLEILYLERQKRAGIDSDHVINCARDIYERSMELVPVLDSKNKPVTFKDEEGRKQFMYKWDSSGANKALDTMGRAIGSFITRREYDITEHREVVCRIELPAKVEIGAAVDLPDGGRLLDSPDDAALDSALEINTDSAGGNGHTSAGGSGTPTVQSPHSVKSREDK